MDDSIRPRKPSDPPPVDQAPQLTEAQRIAADLAYNEFKNTGALQRAEADRALAMQIDRHSNYTSTGLWA